MANALDFLGKIGKTSPSEIERFFGNFQQFSTDESPMEKALKLGISKAQSGQNALPSPAAVSQEGISPTDLSATQVKALEPMPVGRGSWFNRPQEPASLQTYLRRAEMQEALRMKEGEAITKYVLNTPELTGRSPEEFVTLKQAQDEANSIRKRKENPIKEAKSKADLRASEAKAKKLETENKISEMLTGGGSAPTVPSAQKVMVISTQTGQRGMIAADKVQAAILSGKYKLVK